MQACEVCGHDTSEGARVCASCRDHAGATNDDSAAVLTTKVERVRATRTAATPPDTERGRNIATGRVAAPQGRRTPSGMERSDVHEQIVLREVEPGDNDRVTPRPEPSKIAASLVEAFERRQRVDPPQPPGMGSIDLRPDAASTISSDGMGDGRAPSVAATSLPHDSVAMRTNTLDEARPDGPHRTATQDASPRTSGADRPTAAVEATGRFATIPTVPLTPPGDSAPDGAAPAAGDGAPPDTTDDGATEVAATDTTPDVVHDPGAPDASTTATSADDDAHGDAAHGTDDVEDRTAGVTDEEPETDTWTAVAQVMLLIVGMLCVFQVVVLLVVHQFLLQAGSSSPDTSAVLNAHDKVMTVMLPALAGGAVAAATFAAWRAMTMPTRGRRMLGLPVTLWGVVAGAAAVLAVILLGTSTTVAQAQRVTQLAIAACAALGVASIASPRSLADPSIDPVADADA